MFKDIFIAQPYKSISVVGLAKNVGKTTALNCLIQSARETNRKVGVCSIGVDGEKQDVWHYHEKPPIRVYKGMLAATAAQCLTDSSANVRIIEELKSHSTMGAVFIVEVLGEGMLKLAGTHTTDDVDAAFSRFHAYGAEMCFVDGAYDRLSHAKPDLTEAAVLCVGASISPSFETLIEEVANAVTKFKLPSIQSSFRSQMTTEIGYAKDGVFATTGATSLMSSMESVRKIISSGIDELYIPGGLTDKLFDQLTHAASPYTIVIQDGTRCFVSNAHIKKWFRRGGSLAVLRPNHLFAVTVNPHSPQGYHFHPTLMMESIKKLVGNTPVIDCVRGESLV